MKDRAQVAETVHQVMSDQLGVKREDIKNESLVMENLGADSLDHVELVMELEQRFGIVDKTTDEQWDKCNTVQDYIDLCCRTLEVA